MRHRYVHGGFKGTDLRFSYYLPAKDQYDGRFFQYVTPVPDSETLSQNAFGEDDKIGFSLSSGAYLIETKGGGTASTIPQSAASAPMTRLAYALRVSGIMIMAFGVVIGGMFTAFHLAS